MTASVASNCQAEVLSRIRALALPGLSGDEIQSRDRVIEENTIHRGITIRRNTTRARPFFPNNRDDMAYDIGIIMVVGQQDGVSPNNTTEMDYWRQQITREFIQQRLTSVPENYICHVLFGEVILSNEEQALYKHWDHGTMLIRPWCREPRGTP